jgi:Cdc6-like AAA superfamily ATPase
MHKISDGLADLKISNSSTINAVAVIKNHTTSLQDDAAIQRKRGLLEWICPADYSVQHGDYIDRRQPETGEWFLRDPEYQKWVQSEQSTLFCPGMPGAGKTMMATLVIDRLLRTEHEAEHPVVFIYCDYKRRSEQSTKHMLSSLLRQIIEIQEGIPKIVQDFCTAHAKKRTTPSTQEIEQILRDTAKGLLGLTVVIDALDECEAEIRQDFLSIVETLRNLRLLATSRDLPETRSYFLGKPTLEVRASDQDLEKMVKSRIRRLDPDLLELVVSSIVKAAGGM